MHTQKHFGNDNIYIKICIILLSEVTKVNYRPLKVTRGKKLATPPKMYIFLHVYSNIHKKSNRVCVFDYRCHWWPFYVTQAQKLVFKRGKNMFLNMYFLMDHHYIISCNRYAILKTYFR